MVYSARMAKLTSIDLPDATDKKGRKEIPTVNVLSTQGDIVKRYNEAADIAKQADAAMKELIPTLRQAGLEAVFEHNCSAASAKERISSVNLVDVKCDENGEPLRRQEPNGEITLLSWTKKDMKNDPKQVNVEFNRLRTVDNRIPNINNYAAFEVVAEFDASVFLVDGKFSKKRYDEFVEALDIVSKRHGVSNQCAVRKDD